MELHHASVFEAVAEHEIIDWVRARVAHYKAPRRVVIVDKVPRLPNGKPDYPTTHRLAERGTGAGPPAP
jgi:acyl-CoA synthetase (AMP-forming)/AMP-acid ligase II